MAIHTGHDASITLWRDYDQVAIFKEERYNRIKNWGRDFPVISLQKIKKEIDLKEVDVLLLSRNFYDARYVKESFNIEMKKRLKKMLGKAERKISLGLAMRRNNCGRELDLFDLHSFLFDHGFSPSVNVMFCDHHTAHFLPTLFFQPGWDSGLLYTSDGGGDGLHYSFNHFENDEIHEIYGGNDILFENYSPDSLGQMYGMVTEICGFRKNRHEGKITGLAAFSEPIRYKDIVSNYNVDENGRIRPLFKSYPELYDQLQKIHDKDGREVLASSAQLALEELTLESINRLKEKRNFSNIGLSGGVHANVRLNQKISEIPGVKDLFVFPPMGDEGLVVGYVLDYLRSRDGLKLWLEQRRELKEVYWGEDLKISKEEIPGDIELVTEKDVVNVSAELLEKNMVCALFTSRMEYGPRALGARSILINPSDKTINDTVNQRLDRTEFMPFAPYVTEEMCDTVFEMTDSNRQAMKFMTITTNVKEEWKDVIQAAVHIDGTARPQVISRSDNEIYYDILQKFWENTGIPCLVNTSFNAHEEPIINTPAEAIKALQDNRIDYLITEDFILKKNEL